MQPKAEEVRFDLASALRSVVMLRAKIPDDAFTAEILGTERFGNGIVIRVPSAEIRRVGRASQGVRTMRVDEGGKVVAIAPVITSQTDEE